MIGEPVAILPASYCAIAVGAKNKPEIGVRVCLLQLPVGVVCFGYERAADLAVVNF